MWPGKVKFGRLLDIQKDRHGEGTLCEVQYFLGAKVPTEQRGIPGEFHCGSESSVEVGTVEFRACSSSVTEGKFVRESQGGRGDHW